MPHFLHSMTGFGQSKVENDQMRVSCEIKSLNSRYLDLHLRTPANLKEKELEYRKALGEYLHRGKIEVVLSLELKIQAEDHMDSKAFTMRYNSLKKMHSELNESGQDLFALTLQTSNFWEKADLDIEEDMQNAVKDIVMSAAKGLMAYRHKEGESMDQDLRAQLEIIDSSVGAIRAMASGRKEIMHEKLSLLIEEKIGLDQLDQSRLEQELLFYLEKWDINEELVRLIAHCAFFTDVLNNNRVTKGKKLNFIAQEMGREINTTGAKANQVEIQQEVVKMKEALERIKELVLNIL